MGENFGPFPETWPQPMTNSSVLRLKGKQAKGPRDAKAATPSSCRGQPRNWSIGSNNLTAAGRSELLKDLGQQLQHTYGAILTEPAPDRIKQLLEKLERSQRPDDEGSL